jgi:cytochrome c peroxidase
MNRSAGTRSVTLLALMASVVLVGCDKPASQTDAAKAAESSTPPVARVEPSLMRAQALFEPIPLMPPELPGNPSTTAKVALGKMLYFDPRL